MAPMGEGVELPGGRARLADVAGRRMLSVPATTDGFAGELVDDGESRFRLVDLTSRAAERMRQVVPALAPRPLGKGRSSFGFGDRLGLATPGHVRALRLSGTSLAPVLAQQSARELERTDRTFRDVLDAATWGAIEAGWTSGYGADADHLRTESEVMDAVAAGFTTVTLDPSAHVDATALTAAPRDLEHRVRSLPWPALEDDWEAVRRRHGRGDVDEVDVARTAATYGHALAHVATLWRAADDASVAALDVEVSVDEIDVPTSAFAHRFLATELERLGVGFTALALRFPGAWYKGVEVAGDLDAIAGSTRVHARIAEEGGYRLSLHSGSDKLAVYPMLAAAGGTWHVKTSGTSYLEALRVVATFDRPLFADVLALARTAIGRDRRSYAIAETAGVPDVSTVAPHELHSLLDEPDARQCLHVTFGSVLMDDPLATRVRKVLAVHGDAYADALAVHFSRHLALLADLA